MKMEKHENQFLFQNNRCLILFMIMPLLTSSLNQMNMRHTPDETYIYYRKKNFARFTNCLDGWMIKLRHSFQ